MTNMLRDVPDQWRTLIVFAAVFAAVLAVAGCGGDEPRKAGDAETAAAARLGLTRTLPATYERACEDLAAYAPTGIGTCPPLVPKGALEVQDAQPVSKRKGLRDGWVSDFESRSVRPVGHWRVDVAWSPAVRELLVTRGVERPVNAGGATSDCHWGAVGGERVEACQVLPYEAGGGVNGDHVAYVWPHGKATYVVSVHGRANGPRARAMMEALIAKVAG